MPEKTALFLFSAATVVAVFAFLSIAVWVTTPAQERRARMRFELLKTLAENPGENATRVLNMLEDEERRREQRRREDERRGYIVGGLVTGAVGIGVSLLLGFTQGGGVWSAGLMFVLIGIVLIGVGFSLNPGSRTQR